MTMTKSRKVTASVRKAPFTDLPLRFTPSVSDLCDQETIDAYVDKRMDELKGHREGLAGVAFGHAGSLQFMLDILMEAAFERIAKLEGELKKSKSLVTKDMAGPAGRFTLDDLHVEQIDDRNVRIAMVHGDDEAAFELKFPVIIDRGIWSDRANYERGDAVTHQGSLWIAQHDNPAKPDTPDSGWRLSVKRGQDAKGEHR